MRSGGLQVFAAATGKPLYRIEASRRSRMLPVDGRLFVVDSDYSVRVFHKLP